MGVHPRLYLVGWGNRLGTLYQWLRNLVFTKNRSHRIITYSRAKKDINTGRLPSRPPCGDPARGEPAG